VRIVAGKAKGRTLQAPPGSRTRPTSDRVREAMFSMLVSLGGIDDAEVADLFAGSGALGIEALSRGARRATFVDWDREALRAVGANLDRLGLAGPSARLVNADARHHAATVGPADVVFADPPYVFEAWTALLDALTGGGFEGLAVLESGAEVELAENWDAIRAKRYGSTVVTIARPLSPGPSSQALSPDHLADDVSPTRGRRASTRGAR